MLEIEVIGEDLLAEPLSPARVRRLCLLVLASAGVQDGHLAVELVTAERIAQLNERHRGKAGPTDVLSFPIDGIGTADEPRRAGARADVSRPGGGPPRELGDIVICPEHTVDLEEAIVHGALHLLGMDHEIDNGEMLALQAELLRWGRA